MKKRSKRLSVVLISILMLCCAFGITAFAEDSGDTHTHQWEATNPQYYVSNPDAAVAYRCTVAGCKYTEWTRIEMSAADAAYTGDPYDVKKNISYDGMPEEGLPDGMEFTVGFFNGDEYLEEAPVDAGSYIAEVALVINGEPAVYMHDTFEITKLPVTVTADAVQKTYGEDDPELTFSASGILEGESAQDVFKGTLGRAGGENAGKYRINAGDLTAVNYEIAEFVSADFAIKKADVPEVSINDWKYGQEAQKPVVKYGKITLDESAYTYQFRVLDKDGPGEAVDDPVDPGKYRVIVSVPATSNYNLYTTSLDVEIFAATPEFVELPVPATNLEYNGEMQKLLKKKGKVKNGTLKYAVKCSPYSYVKTSDYSEEVPQARNAGTYYIFFMIDADESYGDTYSGPVPVVISRQGTESITVLPIYINPRILPSLDFSASYWELILSLSKFMESGDVKIDNFEYGEPVLMLTVVNGKLLNPLDEGLAVYTYKGTTAAGKEKSGLYLTLLPAGNYTVTTRLLKTFNHDEMKTSVDLEVLPAVPEEIKEPKAVEGLVYNGRYQKLLTPGSAVGGRVVYSTSAEGEYTTSIPTAKEVGDYEVFYKYQATDSNHKDSIPVKVFVSIADKTQEIDVSDDSGSDTTAPAQDDSESTDSAAEEQSRLDRLKAELEYSRLKATKTPGAVKLKSASGGKGCVTVKFKRLPKNVTKYEIVVTDRMTNQETIRYAAQKKSGTISVKVIGLNRKTKYNVKVRAYNTAGGYEFFGAYSKAKTFKTR